MSRVFFAPRRADFKNPVLGRYSQLIEEMRLEEGIGVNDTVAVKVHFGEEGVTSFLRPIFLRPLTDRIRSCGGLPFLTDSNTLYRGERSDGVRHLETALRHGFGYEATGAPAVIADGMDGGDRVEVEVDGEYFSRVYIAGEARRAKAIVVLSHFKGHMSFGFGGALKNIGMGLASKMGKLEIHSGSSPRIKKKNCIGCGVCAGWCPSDAIKIKDGTAFIEREKCSGCGQCVMVCPQEAISVRWGKDNAALQRRTAEYAAGVMKNREGRIWFMNFLMDVTPECDCFSFTDSPVVPEIGILGSNDPVALDQACWDLVSSAPALPGSAAEGAPPGAEKFSICHPGADPGVLLSYASELGLGERQYSLVEISNK